MNSMANVDYKSIEARRSSSEVYGGKVSDREPASRRSAALGLCRPRARRRRLASSRLETPRAAANPRADPGDAAGVDLNTVLGRAVLDAVKQVCRRHGNFWQGLVCRPRSLDSHSGVRGAEEAAAGPRRRGLASQSGKRQVLEVVDDEADGEAPAAAAGARQPG